MLSNYNTKDHPRHFLERFPESFKYKYYKPLCDLCEKEIYFEYRMDCYICKSSFHERCLTITYPQVHSHPLLFIRRQNSSTCNICGLIGADKINMYVCVPCDFFVHRNCIFLPKVIKITRHPHRLLHIYSTPNPKDCCCKICGGIISHNCQGYISSAEACDYVAHAYCATRSEVWGGIDLTGVPEEEVDDDEVEIDGIGIHHFSHHHNLLRSLVDSAEEAENSKVCEACILPIDVGSFFCCQKCNFALHVMCARLPREMEHMLHRHPLVLLLQEDKTNVQDYKGFFTCSVCNQDSCGFMYKCKQGCEFRIDVKCASFVEPFNHKAHQHPLFLKQQFDNRSEPYNCMACSQSSTIVATCSDRYCGFSLDFKCTTLPGSLKYCKYDTHPLILSSILCTPSFPLWCEICEEEVQGTNLFYMCKYCCTTTHSECLLGKHPYLKSGRKIKFSGYECDIVSNKSGSSRTCHTCQCLCRDKMVLINKQLLFFRTTTYQKCFCSIKCFSSFVQSRAAHGHIDIEEAIKFYGGPITKFTPQQ